MRAHINAYVVNFTRLFYTYCIEKHVVEDDVNKCFKGGNDGCKWWFQIKFIQSDFK